MSGEGRGVVWTDEPWMRRAIAVAAGSVQTGDVPVGAVVYGPDGQELATGHNRREATGDPTAHAEVVALRAAAAVLGSWRLSGCTLVVTLEPCTMCAGALVLARVQRLVFGAWEPKTGAVGSLWDVVRDRRLNHRRRIPDRRRGGQRSPACHVDWRNRRSGAWMGRLPLCTALHWCRSRL